MFCSSSPPCEEKNARARLLFIIYYIGKALKQKFYNMKMHGKVAWRPKEPKKAVNIYLEAIIRFDALLSFI